MGAVKVDRGDEVDELADDEVDDVVEADDDRDDDGDVVEEVDKLRW